ncbi:MAG TPA: helix-turn-helix domain-containing protein [Mucilaginibacter sp.]|nr:helix-turn-helix domain-containing protein [Mucilaginibacter sp.]
MKNIDLAKKIKEIRNRKGLSQEQLADKSGLSLRTIQRIENGESVPRGDTLRRLAEALQVSPDEFLDWAIAEDKNILTMLSLSQFGFAAFPLLGIIIPLGIWILKKDKIKDVDKLGKAIINFQITWTIIFFLIIFLSFLFIGFTVFLMGAMYLFNAVMIIINTIKFSRTGESQYRPAYAFLK